MEQEKKYFLVHNFFPKDILEHILQFLLIYMYSYLIFVFTFHFVL